MFYLLTYLLLKIQEKNPPAGLKNDYTSRQTNAKTKSLSPSWRRRQLSDQCVVVVVVVVVVD